MSPKVPAEPLRPPRQLPNMASTLNTSIKTAKEIIAELNLKPHPEKGYFIETFRDSATDSNGRAHSTQIYYLLEGESGLSHWHRVTDAVEVWHYYAGAPLQLSLSWDDGKPIRNLVLGTDLSAVSQEPHTTGQKHSVDFKSGPASSDCSRAGRMATCT